MSSRTVLLPKLASAPPATEVPKASDRVPVPPVKVSPVIVALVTEGAIRKIPVLPDPLPSSVKAPLPGPVTVTFWVIAGRSTLLVASRSPARKLIVPEVAAPVNVIVSAWLVALASVTASRNDSPAPPAPKFASSSSVNVLTTNVSAAPATLIVEVSTVLSVSSDRVNVTVRANSPGMSEIVR